MESSSSNSTKAQKNEASRNAGKSEIRSQNVIMTRGFRKRKPVVIEKPRSPRKASLDRTLKTVPARNLKQTRKVEPAKKRAQENEKQPLKSKPGPSKNNKPKVRSPPIEKKPNNNKNNTNSKNTGNSKRVKETKKPALKDSDESDAESDETDSNSSSESESSSSSSSSSESSSSSDEEQRSSDASENNSETSGSTVQVKKEKEDVAGEVKKEIKSEDEHCNDPRDKNEETGSAVKPEQKYNKRSKRCNASRANLKTSVSAIENKNASTSTPTSSWKIKSKIKPKVDNEDEICVLTSNDEDSKHDDKIKKETVTKTPVSRKKRLISRRSSCSSHCSASSFSSDVTKSSESKNALHPKRKKMPSRPGIEFKIGTRLEAKDFQEKWYPAKIIAVDEEDGDVLIHFERWSSRYDEWMPMDSPQLRAVVHPSTRQEQKSKKPRKVADYKVGEEVLARWSDCKMYPAKVVEQYPDGAYNVLFYDGFHRKVHTINMQKMPEDFVGKVDFPSFDAKDEEMKASSKHSPSGSHPKEVQRAAAKADKEAKKKTEDVKPAVPKRQKSLSKASPSTSTKPDSKSGHSSGRKNSRDSTEKKIEKKSDKVEDASSKHEKSSTASSSLTSLAPTTLSLLCSLVAEKTGDSPDIKPEVLGKNIAELLPPPPVYTPDGRRIAPKEFIIEEDHNHFKCDVAGCGKSFRKEILLRSHKKHYHSSSKSNSSPKSVSISSTGTEPSESDLPSVCSSPNASCEMPVDDHQASSSSSPSDKTPMHGETANEVVPLSNVASNSALSSPIQSAPQNPSLSPTTLSSPKSSPIQTCTMMTRKKSQEGNPKPEKDSVQSLHDMPFPEVRTRRRTSSTRSDKTDTTEDSERAGSESTRKSSSGSTTAAPVSRKGKLEKHSRTASSERSEETVPDAGSPRELDPPTRKKRRLNSAVITHDAESLDSVATDASHNSEKPKDESTASKPADVKSEGTKPSVGRASKSKTEEPKEVFTSEIVHCVCNSTEEDGLMMQCDICLSWQHAACFNIAEENLKDKYVCYACLDPAGLRESYRYRYEQDWLTKGDLATFSFLEKPPASVTRKESIQATHQLNSSMQDILKVLRSLRYKLNIAGEPNHPCLKLWAKPWSCLSSEEKHDKHQSRSSDPQKKENVTKESSASISSTSAPALQNMATYDHSYFSPARSEKLGADMMMPDNRDAAADESSNHVSVESESDAENHDFVGMGNKRWPLDNISPKEEVIIEQGDELSLMMNIAESIEVVDTKGNSENLPGSSSDQLCNISLIGDNENQCVTNTSLDSTARVAGLGEEFPSIKIDGKGQNNVAESGNDINSFEMDVAMSAVNQVARYDGMTQKDVKSSIVSESAEPEGDMIIDVDVDNAEGLADYADKPFEMLEPLSELEIMEAAAMSEADILRVTSLAESDVLDVVEMCDPSAFDSFDTKPVEKLTPPKIGNENKKNKKAETPDLEVCRNNLLDHLNEMYEELDLKMDLIEKYVTALETEYGLLIPKSGEETVEGMPHLKQALKRFSKDLDIIQRMTYFQKEEEES